MKFSRGQLIGALFVLALILIIAVLRWMSAH
jgi:hypothetical protein